jgi:membrane associated rhomboid family serine protease
MEPTKQDAEAMLEEAGGIQVAVRARTPREHVPFLAWGLLVALFGPIRDLGDDSVLGGILLWVAPAVSAAILVSYLRRCRQVRVRPRTPNWLALAFGAWVVAATAVLPGLVDGAISFAYSLGGVLGAAPLVLWAERLRRNA